MVQLSGWRLDDLVWCKKGRLVTACGFVSVDMSW